MISRWYAPEWKHPKPCSTLGSDLQTGGYLGKLLGFLATIRIWWDKTSSYHGQHLCRTWLVVSLAIWKHYGQEKTRAISQMGLLFSQSHFFGATNLQKKLWLTIKPAPFGFDSPCRSVQVDLWAAGHTELHGERLHLLKRLTGAENFAIFGLWDPLFTSRVSVGVSGKLQRLLPFHSRIFQ